MRFVRGVSLVAITAIVVFGLTVADAGPNAGSEIGKRVTQVKTKYGEVLVGTFSGWTKGRRCR